MGILGVVIAVLSLLGSIQDQQPPLEFKTIVVEIEVNRLYVDICTQGGPETGITIRAHVIRLPDGDTASYRWQKVGELGSPCLNEVDRFEVDISSWDEGVYQLLVEAKTSDDPFWEQPVRDVVFFNIVRERAADCGRPIV